MFCFCLHIMFLHQLRFLLVIQSIGFLMSILISIDFSFLLSFCYTFGENIASVISIVWTIYYLFLDWFRFCKMIISGFFLDLISLSTYICTSSIIYNVLFLWEDILKFHLSSNWTLLLDILKDKQHINPLSKHCPSSYCICLYEPWAFRFFVHQFSNCCFKFCIVN